MADHKHGRVKWVGEQNFVAKSGSGFQVNIGSGESAHGASPMEVVLLALGGCTALDIVGILRKQRQQLTGLEIVVDGVRRDEHPRIYTDIKVRYIVSGEALDEKAVARAIALSEEKYCSVSAMLGVAARITTDYEIHPATLPDQEMPELPPV